MLLEAKVRAFDLVTAKQAGAHAHEARRESRRVSTSSCDGIVPTSAIASDTSPPSDTEACITFDGRPAVQ